MADVLGPPAVNFFGMLSGIGNTFNEGMKEGKKDREREELKIKLADAVNDPTKLAAVLASTGSIEGVLGAMKLGQEQKKLNLEESAGKAFSDMLGGKSSSSSSSSSAPAAPSLLPSGAPRAAADPQAESKFIGALRDGGLTNPHGLAAMAAYANAESGYSPKNINGAWSDPSESGGAGTSGGILSWRNDRLKNMRAATAGEADPVIGQAKFALTENPELTAALQNAKTPEEAHALMANAWKFAGYNRPGGESARRLAMVRDYLPKVMPALGGGTTATAAAPPSLFGKTQSAEADAEYLRRYNAGESVQGLAAADKPAPGAREAQFKIPGQAEPSLDAIGASSGDPLPQLSTPQLMQAVAMPHLPAGQRELAKTILTRRLDESKLDPETKRYLFDKAQGFQGTRFDWEKQLKAAGKTEVNVDTKGEGEFEKKFNGNAGERWDGYLKQGAAANRKLSDIQRIRVLSERGGDQGALIALKGLVAPYAAAAGFEVPQSADIQEMDAIVQRLAPQSHVPGSGSQSDIEFKGLLKSMPQLWQNPVARTAIVDSMEAVARHEKAVAGIATQLAARKITRADAEQQLQDLPDPMTGFATFRENNPDLFKSSAAAPRREWQNPPQAGEKKGDASIEARKTIGTDSFFKRGGKWFQE